MRTMVWAIGWEKGRILPAKHVILKTVLMVWPAIATPGIRPYLNSSRPPPANLHFHDICCVGAGCPEIMTV